MFIRRSVSSAAAAAAAASPFLSGARVAGMRVLGSTSVGALSSAAAARSLATKAEVAAMSPEEWSKEWAHAVSGIRADLDFEESSQQLRELIQTGLLRFTDIRDNPERFFEAHRLLAYHATNLGPGFWIRFTVQYNLFAGSVMGLASDEQRELLEDMQDRGELGCFALTEKFAGVNSGMVVNTQAEWDEEQGDFVLSTPDEGAEKNWISQGYTADKALVLASLTVKGKPLGPHAFVMNFRENGELVPGVELTDMGRKTIGNDLDNASIRFDGARVPREALLSRFCEVSEEGEYKQTVKGVKPFAMIGQRLFTGRVAVAQAATSFRKRLFERTKEYSDGKNIWAPPSANGTMPEVALSSIPQLKSLYEEEQGKAQVMDAFLDQCEAELSECLQRDEIPPEALIEAIAVAKVRAVEESIDLSFRLKQEVGSYALMDGSGFEQSDFLQCCKFAEGDSRILMLKMARDKMKAYQRDPTAAATSKREAELCAKLTEEIGKEVAETGDQAAAWDNNFESVYELARGVMERTFEDTMRRAEERETEASA